MVGAIFGSTAGPTAVVTRSAEAMRATISPPIDETAEAEVAAMRARGGRKASEMGYRLDSEELKVLQGAPDYVLQGKKSERHYAVGNMVPPPLAEAVGRQIRKALER